MENAKLLHKQTLMFLLVFLIILSRSAAVADEHFSTIDLDGVAEWLTFEVQWKKKKRGIWEVIEKTLEETAASSAPITEDEIDEAIEAEVFSLDEEFKNGDLNVTRQEYAAMRKEILEQDRDQVREELLEVDGEDFLYSGVAASELLAWALGCPTSAFDCFVASEPMYSHQGSASELGRGMRPRSVEVLVKNAIELVEQALLQLKTDGLGLYEEGDRSALQLSLQELLGNLSECREKSA